MITIALDAMGADGGPAPLVCGAAQITRESVGIHIKVVGDRALIADILAKEEHDPARLSVVHAPEKVAMTDRPAEALDGKPDCSILAAARLVAGSGADALVSAGNTGAVILAAARTFERLPGVRRVGLASVYPTLAPHGPHKDPFAMILDVGATLRCDADDLMAFAVMGSAYSRIISDIDAPRVALLSNGAEPHKGTAAIVAAHERLERSGDVAFMGNVEGVDIPRGTADVIVCEGFVGNIVLKMLEGVSEVVQDMARAALDRKLRWRVALSLMSSAVRRIKKRTDWKQYGGAPIVGFDHPVIKAHGRSNAWAIRNAIKVAAKTVKHDLTGVIRRELAPS